MSVDTLANIKKVRESKTQAYSVIGCPIVHEENISIKECDKYKHKMCNFHQLIVVVVVALSP